MRSPRHRRAAAILGWALAAWAASAPAYTLTESFDAWLPTTAFGDAANAGWSLRNAEVRGTRLGYAPTISGNAVWLADTDAYPETWLQTPFVTQGVRRVSFAARRNLDGTGDNVFALQSSADGDTWQTDAVMTNGFSAWTTHAIDLLRFSAHYLRIRKLADTATGQFLGIEDVVIQEAAGVMLSNLRHLPSAPMLGDPVHVYADLQISPSATAVSATCFYRFGTNGAFAMVPMDVTAGITYRTRTPLPPGEAGTIVQYYVEASFTGPGNSPQALPEAGASAPAAFLATNPYLTQAPLALDPCSRRTPLTITEIMYHPAEPEDTALEFIELFNTEPVALDISGYALDADADYTFPSNTLVPARGFLVVAANPDALQERYGIGHVVGPFQGPLPNDIGHIRLRNRLGAILLDVEYADSSPWPKAADGTGHSLVLAQPDRGESDPAAWTWSAWVGGSPANLDPTPADPRNAVCLNEYLSHTDLPEVDFIELFNGATQNVDLSGCGIGTSPTTNAYTLPPGTIIGPRGHLGFDQPTLGFSLSKRGESLFLFNPEHTRVLDALNFGAKMNGVSSGRWPDGAPGFQELRTPTMGTTNAQPRLPDVVIHEIMYNPIAGDADNEYVELYNTTTGRVDVSAWRLEKGIQYTIPANTTLPPHGYLVIARNVTNLLACYTQLNPANCLGNFIGALADRGERLVLARPEDPAFPDLDPVTVDDVVYHDGWGTWADGGGSSLELVDPRADNRLGSNWAGSDDRAKAPWTLIEKTGVLANGSGTAGAVHLLMEQAGECLVDGIEVLRNGTNRVSNSTFEGGTTGWTLAGNHERSSQETTEGYLSSKSLHLRASGQGMPNNRATATLSAAPAEGQTVTLRVRARWLRGWPVVLCALDGGWMEAAGTMDVPRNLGTPALPNSQALTNAPPAIENLAHSPILPAASQPIAVTCQVDDPDGVGVVTLRYRVDPAVSYTALTMNDAGVSGDAVARDGQYTGLIPGQASGVMLAFYVQASDSAAVPASRTSPPLAPAREALVRVGSSTEAGVLGTYQLWLTQAAISRWNGRDVQSNEPLPATFVYGTRRAIYSAGVRYRGAYRAFSGPTSYESASDPKTPNQGRGAFHLEMAKADRVLGSDEFKLDAIGQISRHYTIWGERHNYWLAEQLDIPYVYPRFINLRINESDRGTLEDLQTPARDFAASWYPAHDDPPIFKMESADAFVNFTQGGDKSKARYRTIWARRRTETPSDDFEPLYRLVDALNRPDSISYEARVRALIDLPSWLGYFALNHIVGNEDTWGYINTHNAFVEATPGHHAHLFPYDMDWSLGFQSADFSDGLFHCDDAHALRLLSHPPFRRQYWRLLLAAAEGPMAPERNDPIMDAWYAALVTNRAHMAFSTGGQPPYSPDTPSPQSPSRSIRGYIQGRRAYIQQQLLALTPPVMPFEIQSNGGSPFSTSSQIATLAGRAPIQVAALRLNGLEQRVTFPTVTNWSTSVGLSPGDNVLAFDALDEQGRVVGSDSITVTYVRSDASPVGLVVINEIQFHPNMPDAEFVELHNRSASQSFDLRGWQLNGVDITLPGGTILAPGAYAVLAADGPSYMMAYSNAEDVIGWFTGALDDGGERLQLRMPAGSNAWMIVDEVRYDRLPPWPLSADGGGPSLQLLHPSLDNRQPGSWAAASGAALPYTPGAANSVLTNLAPMAELWINEIMPSNTASILDNANEPDPWIELINTATSTLDLAASSIYLTDSLAAPARWALPAGTSVPPGGRLLVWVDGDSGQNAPDHLHANFAMNSVSGLVALVQWRDGQPFVLDAIAYASLPADTSFGSYPDGDPLSRQTFHTPTPGAANNPTSNVITVRINEWMADNEGSVADPTGGTDDWFELWNPGPDRVYLGGCFATDSPASTNGYRFPGWISIAGYGHLTVWADRQTAANAPGVDPHVDFRLDKGGDAIAFFAPDRTPIDTVAFGAQQSDVTQGRWPDGAADVFSLAWPTPGASNQVLRLHGTEADPAPASFTIQWSARSGSVYRIDCSEALASTNWRTVGIVTGQANPLATFEDPATAGTTQRFYRVLDAGWNP